MVVEIRPATPADAPVLASLAERTFGLACPPGTSQDAIDSFLAKHLSETGFDGYLKDADRALFLAVENGEPVGYTMVVFAEPSDPDVASALTLHPTAELSKVYVLAEHHGSGIAATLVETSIQSAIDRGAAGIWLGVNQQNARANRFYEKQGFALVGTKKFLVGDRWEDDFVREKPLPGTLGR